MIPIVHSEWYCPNCGKRAQLAPPKARQVHFHTCPRLRGLSAPLIPVGIAAKVEARDRDDYVRGELVQADENGRPVMSVVTTRDNGQDTVVFAPTARGWGDA